MKEYVRSSPVEFTSSTTSPAHSTTMPHLLKYRSRCEQSQTQPHMRPAHSTSGGLIRNKMAKVGC